MSELKTMKFFEAVPTSKEGFYQPGAFVDGYLKSEADKVIAHNKYKRCLAMWMYLRECYWRCKHHNEQTRADWYNKWMNVFQKLSEKFKEEK